MSYRHEIGVGVLVLVAGGILAWMALRVGALDRPGDTVDVSVKMPDAAGLGPGAVVSIAGVPVGRVREVRLDGTLARAEIGIDPAAEVRTDATFAVRARSLLGEKYLAITPAPPVEGVPEAPLLADGAVIEGVPPQVEADELLAAMAPVVEAIDPRALRVFSKAIQDDPDRVVRMLDDAETLLSNARVASEALPSVMDDAHRTLASVRRTSDKVGKVSDAARPLLARLDGTTARLDALVASVPPERLPALLDELSAAVKEGRAVLQKVDGSTSDLQELLRKANRITKKDVDRFARERGVYVRFLKTKFDPADEE